MLLPCLPFAALPMVMLFEQWRKNAAASMVFATLAVVSVFIQLTGLPYPATRYYQMVNYSDAHHQPKPWHGSLILAQWQEFPTIVRDSVSFPRQSMSLDREAAHSEPPFEARIASMSASQFLASFRNSINLTCANLCLLKAAKIGLPLPIVGALSLVLLAGGVGLVCVGFRDPSLSK
jgi:hypothetical protein